MASSEISSKTMQKQSPGDAVKRCSFKFREKGLWHMCFPVIFTKFVRTPFLQNNSDGWFWRWQQWNQDYQLRHPAAFIFNFEPISQNWKLVLFIAFIFSNSTCHQVNVGIFMKNRVIIRNCYFIWGEFNPFMTEADII